MPVTEKRHLLETAFALRAGVRLGLAVLACGFAGLVSCAPRPGAPQKPAAPILPGSVEADQPAPEEARFRRTVEERPAESSAHVQLIGYLLRSHRSHEALEAARAAKAWLPKDEDLLAAEAEARAEIGDTTGAVAALRPLASRSGRFRLKFAEVLLLAGRQEEALRELHQAQSQPDESHLDIARLYASALEPERALAVVAKIKDLSPADLALLGTLNLNTGRYDAAANALRRALDARPGDPTLSFYRGVALRLGGKPENRLEAAMALDSACSQMPDGRMFQYELALVRKASGDTKGALEALDRAVEHSANAAEVFRDQAELLAAAGERPAAALARATSYRKLADPEAALRVLRPWTDQREPTALAAAAGAFSEKGDGASARKLLDQLPPVDTLPITALWEAYRSYRAIARNNEALAALERLRVLTPDDLKVRDEQADTLQTLGKYPEAELILRELQQLEPQNPYRPYQLGLQLVLWSQKPDAKEEAARWYREAIRISPGFAGPRYRLGLLLMEAKQPKAAIVHFRRALGISPRFADALRGLARAYDAAGDKSLAQETFRLQQAAAEREALIARLKQPDKFQRVPIQNRRALVKLHLAGNEREAALSQLEVVCHLGKPTRQERELLIRLYGVGRRYQRQDEERRALAKGG